MRALLRRPSLLTKFSVLSLLVMVALGIGVGLMLQERIERRALLESTKLGETMTTLGMQPILLPGDLSAGQGERHLDSLDEQLKLRDLDQLGILRLKVFNEDGVIVYSDERSIVGESHPDSPGVRRALTGRVESRVTHGTFDDGRGVRALEVYVPLRLGGAGEPDGVVEIYLPYEPVAAAIAEDSRRLFLLLAGGLLLLYATLFRIVAVASRRLRHQALHDDLTDLPNRTLLYDRMEDALSAAERGGEPAALLLVDLDRFKEVNDTLGHDTGDRLLEEVAARLQGVVRRGDTLARLGGDEFAVLLRGLPDRGMAAELAGRLQDAIARPFTLDGVVAVLDASIGIAHCPEHGTDVHTLVQRADVAMYDAKRSRTSIETYSSERDPYSAERLQLLGELRTAIGAGELVLHYQPKVDVGSQRVIGVEALLRWQHPVHGLLPPVEFVPLAERTGAIGDLTRWVLDAALAQCRAWRDAGLDLTMAVNLAAPNIADATLPDAVAALLELHGVPGDRLECEISEHTVMADPRRAMAILERLRGLGVKLSLDDFGTGHSSLAYLKRLPLDEVKIDRSFVMGMTDDDNDAAIVRTTIDLARNLGLEVVAEGVETAEILRDLSDLSCDVAQGFFLSRPLPAAELDGWLAAHMGPTQSA
ncbi:MAG TPA: EAL domain-containing protein [Solirubrobacteraceae bacterium]|nr:EAL domain-containing protein [Solirubrobacteraceae bacterium]